MVYIWWKNNCLLVEVTWLWSKSFLHTKTKRSNTNYYNESPIKNNAFKASIGSHINDDHKQSTGKSAFESAPYHFYVLFDFDPLKIEKDTN